MIAVSAAWPWTPLARGSVPDAQDTKFPSGLKSINSDDVATNVIIGDVIVSDDAPAGPMQPARWRRCEESALHDPAARCVEKYAPDECVPLVR